MVTRTKATFFFFGSILFVVGFCVMLNNALYNIVSMATQNALLNFAPFFAPVLFFAVLFLSLGKSVIEHRKEVYKQNRKKCIASAFSCLILIVLTLLAVFITTKDYEDSYFGSTLEIVGYLYMIIIIFFLVLLSNTLMWLIVFIKSFFKKRVHDESQKGQ